MHNFFHKAKILDLSSLEDQPVHPRFAENGYESKSILINYGGQIFMWILLLCLYPVFWVLAKTTKIKFFVRIKESYEYNAIFTAMTESFMELSLVVLISTWQVYIYTIYIYIYIYTISIYIYIYDI